MSRCRNRPRSLTLACGATIAGGTTLAAADPPEKSLATQDVAEMSLEELLSLPVTSVAGIAQEWFSTPAAIEVIDADQVRQTGARTLADALRMAPGVFVGRVNSQSFSVGMRGFNGSLANKTLVLIDGRAAYDPLFGGTFWDVQDVLLEDLDRIEVVRGPGATLWGANAVNGVINVITKSAKETQGTFVEAGVGTYERGFGGFRHGFQVGENSWIRLYGKGFERDHLVDDAGNDRHDDWAMFRGGVRFDHEGANDLHLTIQGDVYKSDRIGELVPNAPVPGQNIQFRTDIRDGKRGGGNLLMRVGREHQDRGWTFQTYYDRTERTTNVDFSVDRDTLDASWQHHFKAGSRHEILWGLGARHTRDQTHDGANLIMDPRDADATTYSGFIQDTITLVPDRWHAMIGSKFSHNEYTGFEVQPSARLWWTPSDRHTWWASVSRPVRIPSRTEDQGMIVFGYIDSGLLNGGPLSGEIIPLGVQPNDDLEAEQLLAYETGYRTRLTDSLSIDAALFYNDYDRLIYIPSVIDPWNNDGFGETYGGELAMTWQAAERWRVEASYSYVNVLIHGSAVPADEGNTPHNQFQVRSYLDLAENLSLNAALYYVDNVPQVDAGAYFRLDAGLLWKVTPRFDLAIWGQNLLEPKHHEFSASNVERGVYVVGSWRF